MITAEMDGYKRGLFFVLYLASFAIGTWPIESYAQKSACEQLDSTQAILNCALARHPSARVAANATQQATQGISVAKQIPNPELSTQTIFGSNFYTEFNLAHTFQLGGKRSSRIKRAEAEVSLGQASQAETQEEVYLATLIALYRLRQIQGELAALEDALQSFDRMVKQYRSRPRLSPDQRGSLSLFEIAEQDYKLKRAPIEAETDLRLRELEVATGQAFVPKASALPKKRQKWPPLPSETKEDQGSGAKLREARATLELAQADLDLAASHAWPDVKIGPTMTIQKQSNQTSNAFGFNLTLPLPLYNRNSAGEAYAQHGIERTAIALKAAERENEAQRGYFRKRYEGAVSALARSASAEELGKKHEEVERLFNQGFLSGTVMVEIHRQILDFTRTQNEQELAAIESLVRFHALNGNLIEVSE